MNRLVKEIGLLFGTFFLMVVAIWFMFIKAIDVPESPLEVEPSCMVVPEVAQFAFDVEPVSLQQIQTMQEKCIGIYVETDKYTYDYFGDITATQEWINNMFNEVEKAYQAEGISIYVSDIYVATGVEWSDGLTVPLDLLHEFSEVRGDNVNGRIKHFVTMRPLGGGIAWVGTLCSDQKYYTQNGEKIYYGPYAVSTQLKEEFPLYPSYSWTFNVLTHEMGHTLNSSHTHDCAWEGNTVRIDDCYPGGSCPLWIDPIPVNEHGTIMSYCHLSAVGIDPAKGFGELPGNRIRGTVAICDKLQCAVSCLSSILLNGVISGEYVADTIILDNVTTSGPVILDAKEIIVLSGADSVFNPNVTIFNNGCN